MRSHDRDDGGQEREADPDRESSGEDREPVRDLQRAVGNRRLGALARGRSLRPDVQRRMEDGFGHGFDRVRVREDDEAAAREGARAYTVGHDVVFAAGEYRPDAPSGRRLLAHELAHVVQQTGGDGRRTTPGAAEAEAARAGRAVAEGGSAAVTARAPVGVQRQTPDEESEDEETGPESIEFDGVELRDDDDFLRDQVAWLVDEWGEHDARLFVRRFGRAMLRMRLRSPPNDATREERREWNRELALRQRIHDKLRRFLREVRSPSLSDQPDQGLDHSRTTPTYYNLRKVPSTTGNDPIGKLGGESRPVRVIGKTQNEGLTWFEIELKSTIGTLPTGTTAWVTSDAVVPVASWSQFIEQLRAFEERHGHLTLAERITKLRQMSHESDLPFDSIIGTEEGSTYLDQRGFVQSKWQLLKDYMQVRTPGSGVVDVNHVLVGLDVLHREEEEASYWMLDVGTNWAAATWAGDIGAAVADAYLQVDDTWESEEGISDDYGSRATTKRVEHYFSTRAATADLRGDLDAWALSAMAQERGMGRRSVTIEGILRDYYEGVGSTPPRDRSSATDTRREAIARFLEHYGFTSATGLANQDAADRIRSEIADFASIWVKNRHGFNNLNPFAWQYSGPDIEVYEERMTEEFLRWLEGLAGSHGVSLDSGNGNSH